MAKIKTSITVDSALFAQIEQISASRRLSRSEVFEQAARAFVRQVTTEELTAQIDAAQDVVAQEAGTEDVELVRFRRRAAQRLAADPADASAW